MVDKCLEGAEPDAMESILRRLYNDLGARRQGVLLRYCARQLLLPVPAAAAFPLWRFHKPNKVLLDSVRV